MYWSCWTICYRYIQTASKTAIQKTLEATGDLIGNKITDKIAIVSKFSIQNNSETITCKEENIGLNREIPRERYISPKERENYWWT